MRDTDTVYLASQIILSPTDEYIEIDASGSAFSIDCFDIAATFAIPTNQRMRYVCEIVILQTGFPVTVNAQYGQLINGQSSVTINGDQTKYTLMTVMNVGATAWEYKLFSSFKPYSTNNDSYISSSFVDSSGEKYNPTQGFNSYAGLLPLLVPTDRVIYGSGIGYSEQMDIMRDTTLDLGRNTWSGQTTGFVFNDFNWTGGAGYFQLWGPQAEVVYTGTIANPGLQNAFTFTKGEVSGDIFMKRRTHNGDITSGLGAMELGDTNGPTYINMKFIETVDISNSIATIVSGFSNASSAIEIKDTRIKHYNSTYAAGTAVISGTSLGNITLKDMVFDCNNLEYAISGVNVNIEGNLTIYGSFGSGGSNFPVDYATANVTGGTIIWIPDRTKPNNKVVYNPRSGSMEVEIDMSGMTAPNTYPFYFLIPEFCTPTRVLCRHRNLTGDPACTVSLIISSGTPIPIYTSETLANLDGLANDISISDMPFETDGTNNSLVFDIQGGNITTGALFLNIERVKNV